MSSSGSEDRAIKLSLRPTAVLEGSANGTKVNADVRLEAETGSLDNEVVEATEIGDGAASLNESEGPTEDSVDSAPNPLMGKGAEGALLKAVFGELGELSELGLM